MRIEKPKVFNYRDYEETDRRTGGRVMDRREAIQELASLAWVQGNANRDKAIEALDLAIEALQEKLQSSQETSTIPEVIESHSKVIESHSDLISRQQAIEAVSDIYVRDVAQLHTRRDCVDLLESLPPVTPTERKPILTEEVRKAIMRLTMCAREECSMCKYENDCGFDKQVEMATENMNTILNAFDTTPTERKE